MPNETLKRDYILSTNYSVGNGMLHLKNLELKDFDLREKSFISTEFKNCLFDNCDFTSSIISSCTLVDCSFKDCNFVWTKFFESDFFNVKIINCAISGVEVSDLVCKTLHFENCNDISDLTLHGSFADRQIFFSNCYITYLNVEPIAKSYNDFFHFTDCIFTEDTLMNQNETPGKEYNLIDLRTI